LTGVHGVNGAALLRRLDADERVTHLVLLDTRPPAIPLRKATLCRINLTAPLADVALAEVLVRERVDTVIHAAFEGSPVSQIEIAHELEVIGTRALLRALAHNLRHDDTVGNLVVLGTTMSYGAYPDNPQYLTETMPLRGAGAYPFVADKVAVEGEVARFRARTGLPTAMIRAAWTVGDERTLTARLFAGLAVPAVLGADPLIQLLDLDDLVDAVCLIAHARHDGPFNVAGRGVLPLSTIIKLAARLRAALPDPALRAALQTLWTLGVGLVPGVHVRYLRDTCVADITRVEDVLGRRLRYSTREALAQHVAGRGSRGRIAA
jgi:UDP-glucose 4-epimerase